MWIGNKGTGYVSLRLFFFKSDCRREDYVSLHLFSNVSTYTWFVGSTDTPYSLQLFTVRLLEKNSSAIKRVKKFLYIG